LDKVQDALVNFESDELTVTQKNGMIYIALSDKLLFKSGSATVEKKGKEALGKLAEVLGKNPDIDIIIEGHTDSIAINTTRFKDNWDLSVIRATSVVRILTEEYKLDPKQFLPSGRGEHFPVSTNKTADGRSKNRRTEIILSPKLDELYKLLEEI
jgi:chemotaxis protein MotB